MGILYLNNNDIQLNRINLYRVINTIYNLLLHIILPLNRNQFNLYQRRTKYCKYHRFNRLLVFYNYDNIYDDVVQKCYSKVLVLEIGFLIKRHSWRFLQFPRGYIRSNVLEFH